jgi:hypothetical protein
MAQFASLQALPSYAKPVVSWPSWDEAFVDVAKGLRRTVAEIRAAASAGITRSPASPPLHTPAPVSLIEPAALARSQGGTAPPGDLLPHAGGSLPGVKSNRPQAQTLMLIPTALLGMAALVPSIWRVPTRVAFDLVVDRTDFTVGRARAIGFPDCPVDFQAEDFDQARVGSPNGSHSPTRTSFRRRPG